MGGEEFEGGDEQRVAGAPLLALAQLPPLSPVQLDQASSAIKVGMPPVTEETPPEAAAKIVGVAHDTFVSGMSTASTVAGIVAVIAALVATLTKRGENAEAGMGGGHI